MMCVFFRFDNFSSRTQQNKIEREQNNGNIQHHIHSFCTKVTSSVSYVSLDESALYLCSLKKKKKLLHSRREKEKSNLDFYTCNPLLHKYELISF